MPPSSAIHAHQNLSLAVANSVVAVESGVTRVDASLAGMGAGAGNCPIEPLVAARTSPAGSTGVTCSRCRTRPTTSSVRCRTGPCGSTAKRSPSVTPASTPASCATPNARPRPTASDTRDILVEVGRRSLVGGQEDLIIDVALDLTAGHASAMT